MSDPTPTPTAEPDEVGLSYGAAMAELEAILRELEGDSVDVDRLTDQVRRAAELIRFCRRRIGETRMQIEQVVVELDEIEAHSAVPRAGTTEHEDAGQRRRT